MWTRARRRVRATQARPGPQDSGRLVARGPRGMGGAAGTPARPGAASPRASFGTPEQFRRKTANGDAAHVPPGAARGTAAACRRSRRVACLRRVTRATQPRAHGSQEPESPEEARAPERGGSVRGNGPVAGRGGAGGGRRVASGEPCGCRTMRAEQVAAARAVVPTGRHGNLPATQRSGGLCPAVYGQQML